MIDIAKIDPIWPHLPVFWLSPWRSSTNNVPLSLQCLICDKAVPNSKYNLDQHNEGKVHANNLLKKDLAKDSELKRGKLNAASSSSSSSVAQPPISLSTESSKEAEPEKPPADPPIVVRARGIPGEHGGKEVRKIFLDLFGRSYEGFSKAEDAERCAKILCEKSLSVEHGQVGR